MTTFIEETPVLRRRFLTSEGESLLLNRATLEGALRFEQFTAASGLTTSDVVLSVMCPIPIPDYTTIEPGRRRWASLNPAMMWHPMMWMPQRLALRWTVPDGEGGKRMESDDEWALRVALEMSAAGLYNSETGSWLDVLSWVGLDITDELDLARVIDWLGGAPDDILDAIDLEPLLSRGEPDWSITAVLNLFEGFQGSAWFFVADDLIDYLDAALADPSATESDYRVVLSSMSSMASALLGDLPGGVFDPENPTGVVDSPAAFFESIRTSVDLRQGTPDAQTTMDLMWELRDALNDVRSSYEPSLSVFLDADTPTQE